MKNGPYELVKAPAEYPGMKYRARYVYEHHLVWWKRTGQVVPKGFVVHHKNDMKRDNRFSNLELKTNPEHTRGHARVASTTTLRCACCGIQFQCLARQHRSGSGEVSETFIVRARVRSVGSGRRDDVWAPSKLAMRRSVKP